MSGPSPRDDVHAPLAAPTYLTHITAPRFRRGRAVTVAIILHIAAIIGILLILHFRFPPPVDNEPTVALVMEVTPYTGTGPHSIAAAPAPPTPPAKPAPPKPVPPPPAPATPQAAPASAAPPLPVEQTASALPLPPPPAPPMPQAAPASTPQPVAKPIATPAPPAQAASRAHNGNNQPSGAPLVMGTHIIPAQPDSQTNQPPPYPPEALAHREQGRVLLKIHVLPDGRPLFITVATSSGYTVLDNAARDAVMDWHFSPAKDSGKPIASVLPFWIAFQLN